MDYEKLIRELVDKKSEQDNQIDLHAYENGMRALAEALSIADVVGRSEQLKPFHCPNCKQPWDTRLTNSCQCGASIKRF